ncbi:MAG: hypothetical protein Q7J69_05470 [Candidatus Omnitrophota bacterium]|nr:hypothetical protein [Candidatus Omnitrophota bacterium]
MMFLWAVVLILVTPAAVLFMKSFSQLLAVPWVIPRELGLSLPMLFFFRFMALLHDLGGATIFPLSLLLLGVWEEFSEWVLLGMILAVSALFGAFLYLKWSYAPLQALGAAGMLAAAQLGIEHLLVRPLLGGSFLDRILVLWFVAAFGFCLFSPWPAGARILPAVPPWVLLYLRQAEGGPGRRWLPATAAATLALAIFFLQR